MSYERNFDNVEFVVTAKIDVEDLPGKYILRTKPYNENEFYSIIVKAEIVRDAGRWNN